MVSPAEKRPGSGHSYISLKLGDLLEVGKQEPWSRGEGGCPQMTTVTSWLRVLRLLSKRPKASNPSSRNAFAGPHQGLQNLSAREEGK